MNRIEKIFDRNDFDAALAAARLHDTYVDRGELTDTWLLSQSRERKSRILDALAVLLLLAVTALLGCAVLFLSTGTAKADTEPSPAVVAYADRFGPAVCSVLSTPAHHSIDGVMGVLLGVEDDGWTAREAGQIVGMSVAELCPRNLGLIQQFINRYGRTQVA